MGNGLGSRGTGRVKSHGLASHSGSRAQGNGLGSRRGAGHGSVTRPPSANSQKSAMPRVSEQDCSPAFLGRQNYGLTDNPTRTGETGEYGTT